MNKRLINITELSQMLGVKVGTLYVWVCQKKIPYVKAGRLLKFDLKAIEAWIKERSVPSHKIYEMRNKMGDSRMEIVTKIKALAVKKGNKSCQKIKLREI